MYGRNGEFIEYTFTTCNKSPETKGYFIAHFIRKTIRSTKNAFPF